MESNLSINLEYASWSFISYILKSIVIYIYDWINYF